MNMTKRWTSLTKPCWLWRFGGYTTSLKSLERKSPRLDAFVSRKPEELPKEELRTAMSIRSIDRQFKSDKQHAGATKAKRKKAVAADSIPEPRNTMEALERDPCTRLVCIDS